MAASPLHDLRLPARELLREPGIRREVRADLDAATLGIDDDRIAGAVGVELDAVSSIDGISVTGTVRVPWTAACRRCLTPVSGVATIAVDEEYQDAVGPDDDAFEIDGDQIDLAVPVREYVLLELPTDPLCRDDCAGICPQCGADRNETSCDCDTTVRDERWAALDDLRLDE
jgi:uncharacterized protein